MPWGESADFDIFGGRVLEVHDPGADGRDARLGHDEGVAEAVVEPDGQVAGQLEVLALVVADGHPLGVVGEDVGGHEHRVVEQPDAHRLLTPFADFSLNWVIRRSSPKVATQFRIQVSSVCSVHVALHEQRAALRVEPGGEQEHRGPAGAAPRRSAASQGRVIAWRSTTQ